MPRSIFVSFVFEDKHYYDIVQEWGDDGRLGHNVVVTGETRDARPQGEPAVRQHLTGRIRGAAAVLVLVGDDTHNHGWVQYELSFATSEHKPVLAVRIPGTRGSAPPHFQHLHLYAFEPQALAHALAGLW